jgi:hypothetical protein
MKKTLISFIALSFAMIVGTAVAADAPKAAKADPVAEACKGKKAGDTVKVDGKEVKCPEVKKEAAKK